MGSLLRMWIIVQTLCKMTQSILVVPDTQAYTWGQPFVTLRGMKDV